MFGIEAIQRFFSNERNLFLLLIFQFACVVFFIFDVTIHALGLDENNFKMTLEFAELLVVIVMVASFLATAFELIQVRKRNKAVEERLEMASGAFHDLVLSHFNEWKLTKSERDVALFAIKGFGIAEIAKLRDTKEGTIKAQLNAIYRKADVDGRPQFISLFIEELMGKEPNAI